MSKIDKIRDKILLGFSDSNVGFADLCLLLKKLNFEERIKGSHHIFTKDSVEEIINIQPIGSKAKSYQVRQVRNLILKYKLGVRNE